MKHINVTEMPKIIEAAPNEMSVLFIGDTGIGKTQIIKRYAADNDIFIKTLILSQIEASEALGIPVQTKRMFEGKEFSTIETAVPSWVFEIKENLNKGKKVILYLDEFLCAEPAVMNAFLNFITEKEINGIDLSDVQIIASTNIGNYTYDPDNNILSRFCMFYVENKEYNKYLKKKYGTKFVVHNDYKDEEELDSVIFDTRSLKPRCQEMLCLVKDTSMVDMFYEGYTNTPMMPIFHNMGKINDVVKGFATKDEHDKWIIPNDDVDTMAGFIYKAVSKSTKKDIVDYASTLKNVDYNKSRLKNRLDEIFKGNFNV